MSVLRPGESVTIGWSRAGATALGEVFVPPFALAFPETPNASGEHLVVDAKHRLLARCPSEAAARIVLAAATYACEALTSTLQTATADVVRSRLAP